MLLVARIFRSFATAVYTELAYMCWRRRPPVLLDTVRRYVSVGSRLASFFLKGVSVVPAEALHRVDPAVKATVMTCSTLSGKAAETASDCAGSDSVNELPDVGSKHARKKTKRGNALMRIPSSTSHPTSKLFFESHFLSRSIPFQRRARGSCRRCQRCW